MNATQNRLTRDPHKTNPMKLVLNADELKSKKVILYLFREPQDSKLFVCNRPFDLKKQLGKSKEDTEAYIASL